MKFIETPDDLEAHMLFRMVSEDGKIEIAVHPVLFGFRVRAGYVGEMAYELDYCAGAHQEFVELIYSMVLAALSRGVPFNKFPIQNLKPIFDDPECFAALTSLMIVTEKPVKVDLTGIHEKKRVMMDSIFNSMDKKA